MQAETDKQEPQAVRQLIFRSILFCNFFRSVTVYMAETFEKGVRKTGSQSAKGKIVLFALKKKYENGFAEVRKGKSYFSRGQKSTIAV